MDLLESPPGATPLDPDDLQALIPTWIATRADLNTAEYDNILKATNWALVTRGNWKLAELLTEEAMLLLHKRMFDEVWKWAGDYRRRVTNLGVAPYDVQVSLRNLVADVAAQTADLDALPWPADELALRFHHRLVSIHPFANGNGRHARLAADLLIRCLCGAEFSWGSTDLGEAGTGRAAYLAALHCADDLDDFGPLIAFARS